MPEIAVKALGAVLRDEEVLVFEVEPNDCGGRNFRLLGGTVEFGEHSRETLHREFDEELGVALGNVELVDTYERVFTHQGRDHHEIWQVYAATIVEDWPYDRDAFTVIEPEYDVELAVSWQSVDSLRNSRDSLYGEELLDDLPGIAHPAQ